MTNRDYCREGESVESGMYRILYLYIGCENKIIDWLTFIIENSDYSQALVYKTFISKS